jgi:hypothetical protein
MAAPRQTKADEMRRFVERQIDALTEPFTALRS